MMEKEGILKWVLWKKMLTGKVYRNYLKIGYIVGILRIDGGYESEC